MTWHRAAAAALLYGAAQASAQAPYVDRVLDEGPQPALSLEREIDPARMRGWPRGIRVELTTSQGRGAVEDQSRGIGISGFVDTPNHGALSLSANLTELTQSTSADPAAVLRSQGHLWRLDQRALPLEGGWQANHTLGNVGLGVLPMARGFGRIGLPSTPLEGVAAQYLRGSEAYLLAGAGRPGLYSGFGVNAFSANVGTVGTTGGQGHWRSGNRLWTMGSQVVASVDTADRGLSAGRESVTSGWAGLRSQPVDSIGRPAGGGLQWQASMLTSNRTGEPSAFNQRDSSSGLWLDARYAAAATAQSFGVFALDPGLRWGNEFAISDLRGVYWRGDTSTRRWQLGSSLEWTQRVAAGGGDAGFASVNTAYRINTVDSIFATVAARTGIGSARSAQLGWSSNSGWGQTQWRIDALSSVAQSARRIGIDHTFTFSEFSSLGTSLGVERREESGLRAQLVSWGLLAGLRPWPNVQLTGNLTGIEGGGLSQVSGTMALNWALSRTWSAIAQYTATESRNTQGTSLLVTSALTTASINLPAPVPRFERLQLILRFEDRAGSATVPLGGKAGDGSGQISGTVYFDANGNGRRESSENGVPGITVVLDNRFIVRTDQQGRYEFPAVAPGARTLTLVTDDIPLPWSPANAGGQRIEVVVRGATPLDFPLVRQP